MNLRHQVCVVVAGWLLMGSGCSWLRQFHPHGGEPLAPVVLSASPTVDEVVAAVNANTQAVRSLQAASATLYPSGLPPLRADLALERPQRFRLRAEFSSLLGQELDVGANSPVGRSFPVQPQWIIQSLGLIELSPNDRIEGPSATAADRVELQVVSNNLRRRIVLDSRYGWILEQHLFAPNGAAIASAIASEHRYYSEAGVSLPHYVAIRLGPPEQTQLALELDVSRYYINQLQGDPAHLWALPPIPDVQFVNLAAQPLQAAGVNPQQIEAAHTTRQSFPANQAHRPRYRGDSLLR